MNNFDFDLMEFTVTDYVNFMQLCINMSIIKSSNCGKPTGQSMLLVTELIKMANKFCTLDDIPFQKMNDLIEQFIRAVALKCSENSDDNAFSDFLNNREE